MKLDLTTTLTSSLDLPTSLTKGITRKGREMSFVVRYLRTGILSWNILIDLIKELMRKAIQSPHQLMLAVGRDEADRMLRFKLAQLDAPEKNHLKI